MRRTSDDVERHRQAVAACDQEADLAGACALVGGRGAEAAIPKCARLGSLIAGGERFERSARGRCFDAPLADRMRDGAPAEAPRLLRDEHLREARIGHVAAALEFIERSRNFGRIAAVREKPLLELGVAQRIVEKSGAWYAYQGDKIGQGKDNAREFLREHPDTAREIEAKIRETVGVPSPTRIRSDGSGGEL